MQRRILVLPTALCLSLLLLAGGSQCWGQQVAQVGGPVPQTIYLPGFWQLSQESVRKELEIVPEQIEKLQKISNDFRTKQQEMYAPLRDANLTQEQRQEAYQNIQKSVADMNKDVLAQVKDVLLPHQIKALEDIDFRNRANMILQYPHYIDRLKLTDEQKEKVKKNRDELLKKIQDAQKEALDEVLDLLTPEQMEVLKQPWPAQAWQAERK